MCLRYADPYRHVTLTSVWHESADVLGMSGIRNLGVPGRQDAWPGKWKYVQTQTCTPGMLQVTCTISGALDIASRSKEGLLHLSCWLSNLMTQTALTHHPSVCSTTCLRNVVKQKMCSRVFRPRVCPCVFCVQIFQCQQHSSTDPAGRPGWSYFLWGCRPC